MYSCLSRSVSETHRHDARILSNQKKPNKQTERQPTNPAKIEQNWKGTDSKKQSMNEGKGHPSCSTIVQIGIIPSLKEIG